MSVIDSNLLNVHAAKALNTGDGKRRVSWSPKLSETIRTLRRPLQSFSESDLTYATTDKSRGLPSLSKRSRESSVDVDVIGEDGDSIDATRAKDPWVRQNLLSLDGGGIRGLSELFVLKELMLRIAELEQEEGAYSSASSPYLRDQDQRVSRSPRRSVADSYRPCHYFDYIGGTSTGGIIAILLGRLRFSVDQAIDSYETIWKEMAVKLTRYDRISPLRKAKHANTEGLIQALNKIIESRHMHLDEFFDKHYDSPQIQSDFVAHDNTVDDIFMSDDKMCKTIVLALEIPTEKGAVQRPYLFRSYKFNTKHRTTSVNRMPKTSLNRVQIWEVARATSAAPSYFSGVRLEGLKGKFRDGSMWVSNPAMEMYREMRSMHPDSDEPINSFVSIGCGQQRRSRLRHSLRGSKSFPTSGQEQWLVDPVLRSKAETEGFEYFRLDGPRGLADIDLNEWKSDSDGVKTFRRTQDAVAEYCQIAEVKAEIDRCARHLVNLRQRRAQTSHWERFGLGIFYRCQICKDHPEFEGRATFMYHLERQHGFPPPDEKFYGAIQEELREHSVTTVK